MVVTEDWSFRAEAVTKVYDGTNRANDQITLRVEPGEVYGLLGPNGAGKTTLVKQVIGLLKPTEGRITLGPYDLVADPDAARQLCSYLPQAQMPIDSFRVAGGDRADRKDPRRRRGGRAPRTDALIEALDIGKWRKTMGQQLSGGVKRLVGFAMVTVWPGSGGDPGRAHQRRGSLCAAGCCGTRSAPWESAAAPCSWSPTT